MYVRFQIRAVTQPGEAIVLVGSISEMGLWDVMQGVRLHTNAAYYPLWWADIELNDDQASPRCDRRVAYKYVRVCLNGRVAWAALGVNRWVTLEAKPLPSPIIVEDGWFGSIPAYPYGYFAEPAAQSPTPQRQEGLKVVVLGSSVALGCSAWLLQGWAWHLGQALQHHYGHQLVNVSELGANVSTTIARFSHVVAPEQPDIVIIALSLGNEGLAFSSPRHHRDLQRRFENGLQQLVKMTRELGAYPMLGSVYPNGDYASEHYGLLRETHQHMLTWELPVLDWFAALEDGQGRWKTGIAFDAAHPNTKGHRLMSAAIDLTLFHLTKADLSKQQQSHRPEARPIYQDNWGFQVVAHKTANSLQLLNPTPHPYTISPAWHELQAALQIAPAPAGLYMAEAKADEQNAATLLSLFVRADGTLETTLTIPPTTDLTFHPAFHFFASQHSQLLFYDGPIGILKVSERRLYVINESEHVYNIQPMWQEVRAALKAMPSGVYEDPCHPDVPFRTLIIGNDGLESRVKVPAQWAMMLEYKCSLAAVSRVAIVPLGDRCALRMLLYKMEYDGPAFPFDLTRTTNLADVADMIQNDFHDMWNPLYLHYNHEARRLYHTKWTGLSFAHEVEESDDPVHDLSPVYERMRVRYTARSRRFWHVLQKSDKALFVRTGICDRGAVLDLVQKLDVKYQGKPFLVLIISPQASDEFADLPNVLHYNLELNPDRMYEDLSYWLDCTEVMRGMLHSLGVSSKNLFWCPPNPPKA